MSEESETNHEKIDGQLPQIQDIFSDDDMKKIKKKIADSLKGSKQ
tara:strand:+ start:24704 stop:24838 length:135 start_codon:yes stop_codon:yes gene_type:complete